MQGFNMMLMPVYFQVPEGIAHRSSLNVSESVSEPCSSSSPEVSASESTLAEEVTESLPEQDRMVEVYEKAGAWVQFGEELWARATRLKLLDDS